MIDNSARETEPKNTLPKIVAYYEIVGFVNVESRYNYVKKLKMKYPHSPLSKIPVILPLILKQLFSNIEIGEKILFPAGGIENLVGHFCGFSKINRRIVIPGNIRKPFGIMPRDIVLLRVDGGEKEITFID